MDKSLPLVVLIQLFRRLESTIKIKGFQSDLKMNIKSILLSRLMREGVSLNDCKLVSAFYQDASGRLSIVSAPNEQFMKDAVQYTYNLMCDEIGPVETDLVFGKALSDTESTSEAQIYSPRNFL